jgi:hypothetical protein
MLVIKEWTLKAAIEIGQIVNAPGTFVSRFQEIIAYHCPMKIDTVYMPVPRCETCKHWMAWESGQTGTCVGASGVEDVDKDFGCVKWEAK